jgi:hypothetical protein
MRKTKQISRSEWDEMSQPWAGENFSRSKCHTMTSRPLIHEISGWTSNPSYKGQRVTVEKHYMHRVPQ